MTKDSDLTSSPVVSLVNLSASQEKENQRKMTEISGKKLLELSKSPKFLFLLEKMLMESLNSISTTYLRTWRVQTTPQGALIFQLRASVQNTKGKESGLLPTPTAGNSMNVVMPPEFVKRNSSGWTVTRKGTGTKFGAKLNDVVNYLEKQKLYNTPTTNDSKNLTFPQSQKNRTSIIGNLMKQKIIKTGGKLNPNFVEYLMGFQQDWTKIDQIESKDSETQSAHKSHSTSDKS